MSDIYFWIADWNLSRAQAAGRLHDPVADMVDCTASAVDRVLGAIVRRRDVAAFGAYVTGGDGIQWTADQLQAIKNDGFDILRIDQSNSDLPLIADVKVVKDVEPGASGAAIAAEVAAQRLAAGDDYIIYCDSSELGGVEDALAAKFLPRGRVIAYQYASPTSNPNTPIIGGSNTLKDVNADLSVILRAQLPSVKKAAKPKQEATITFHGHQGSARVRFGGGHFSVKPAHGGDWSIKKLG